MLPLVLILCAIEIDSRLLEFLRAYPVLRLQCRGFRRRGLTGGGFKCIAIVRAIELGQDLALLHELPLFGIHAGHTPANLEGRECGHIGFHRAARRD